MTYTISGKEWTEFDINKRCADLMEVTVLIVLRDYNPCNNPSDTWPIIEKCWDQLIYADYRRDVNWEILMEKHNCTKLIAACICLIEINEGES